MSNASVTIRAMSRSELGMVLGWAAQEGWNPGLYDADSFHAADPESFFLAELDGEPVGSVSAVRYGADFGFLGLYIVRPEWRGRGYGMALWQTAMAHLAGRTVGLDGVVERQDDYRKSGFAYSYRTVRYRCMGLASSPSSAQTAAVLDLRDRSFAELERYDSALFPASRGVFLAGWVRQPESIALGIEAQGELAGYAMLRRCRDCWKVGPLFADKPEYAESLLAALRGRVAAGEAILLDMPEPNAAAMALAAREGMEVVFESARMYAGPAPSLPLERIFGVTSLELG